MNKNQIVQIFKKLTATIKHPTTELIYSSNFELLIAVLLSARTTDKTVNKVTAKLFKIANTPEKMLKLGVAGIKKQIKSIGFYNAKSANIIKTCEILVKKFNSQIPENREELEALPGVGRKTANVILNIAFGKPTIAVDTHVFRVANRIGLAKGKTPEEIEEQLLKITPKEFAKTAGSLLLLHGRYVCTAKNPKCSACCINRLCLYQFKTI
ncbi:endonuclease III [Gammaproteobacteria bacterium]